MPSITLPTIETLDGSSTAFCPRHQQTYHSHFGAVTESRLVFLQNSGIQDRLARQLPTRILEVGFGLGLNFMLTADEARHCESQLQYTAYETELPTQTTLSSMRYDRHLKNPELFTKLIQQIGAHRQQLTVSLQPADQVFLTIVQDDVCAAKLLECSFDAIYLDAFSPDVNAECWHPEFLNRLARSLAPGGRLATYCCKGDVRRALQSAGLKVSKFPGPPGKREVLVACQLPDNRHKQEY